ncbi:MAG: phosphate acyltransferase PlsX [Gemmatimonadetes bacterium RIFCSPLOWO2_02_FULL_71_11]|nr:MAG: phosphate acyltransferase PlsX [Gemmatimonadetes bacterium RIFCSPLOWO2_02_FULL_71_11]
MGGDHAPAAPVAGAALALAEVGDDVVVQLVGRSAAIEAELASQGVARTRIEVVEAPETVGMGDKPLQAVRTKRQSSIAVGLTLQRDGRSDAFISAGNTGAVMAASTLILRLYPGFERPAIGIPFPTVGKPVLVLDGGANVDCSPQELVGFAHLGVLYARDVMDRSAPAVGLLNIGEEEEKGNAATKEAHRLLAASGLSFVGNIEGRDIVLGSCDRGPFDVVVCDGFVGNVLLKFYESTGKLFHRLVDRELGAELAHGAAMQRIWRVLDYAEYGGAPLLGVRGVSIVCHGRSSPEAQRAAVKVAIEAARHHLVQHMTSEFLPGGAAS